MATDRFLSDQISGELKQAIAEADKGEFISHEAMLAWAGSLGCENELPPPEPDVFLHKTSPGKSSS